ncbi:hypothetical protein ACVWYH_007313 [Bradyrhizobium sp. GM24.11]
MLAQGKPLPSAAAHSTAGRGARIDHNKNAIEERLTFSVGLERAFVFAEQKDGSPMSGAARTAPTGLY